MAAGRNQEKGAMFTCPICLAEKHVRAGGTGGGGDKRPAVPKNAVDQDGKPVFQLSACGHLFCAACLDAYVRSKLQEGDFRVPCCHLHYSALEVDDLRPCNTPMDESDIYRLLHMDVEERSEKSSCSDQCCEKCNNRNESSPSSSKDEETEKDTAGGDRMWIKYNKLKFDAHHGKDSVRRCPKCDEAQLFDVESMEKYQATHLTPQKGGAASSAESKKPPPEEGSDLPEEETPKGDGNESSGNLASPLAIDNDEGALRNSDDQSTGSDLPEKETPKGDGNELPGNLASPLAIDDDEGAPKNGDDRSTNDELREGKNAPSARETERREPLRSLVASTTPVVACQNCGTEFCYFHSNAHPGRSCVEYHERCRESDRANVQCARRILGAKPCPNCGIFVSKDGGCNQIKCRGCGTNFCWLCLEIVGDEAFPDHFRWWNLRGCANMQLDEHAVPSRCTVCFARTLSAFQILFLGLPSLALTVASFLLCPCLVPGFGRTNRDRVVNCVSFWGSFLSSLLLLPFTCLGLVLLSAMYLFLASLALFLKLFTSSRGAPGDADTAAGERITSERNAEDANTDVRQDASTDVRQEIENMLERMEEGSQILVDGTCMR